MKCASVSSERGNVLQWAFTLNSAPAAAEIWDFKVFVLRVNHSLFMRVLLVSCDMLLCKRDTRNSALNYHYVPFFFSCADMMF